MCDKIESITKRNSIKNALLRHLSEIGVALLLGLAIIIIIMMG